jgi:hypothetical protein
MTNTVQSFGCTQSALMPTTSAWLNATATLVVNIRAGSTGNAAILCVMVVGSANSLHSKLQRESQM